MDSEAMDNMLEFTPDAKSPFDKSHRFYVLIEIASKALSDESDDGNLDRLFNLIEVAGDAVSDGVVAQDSKQFRQIWDLRE